MNTYIIYCIHTHTHIHTHTLISKICMTFELRIHEVTKSPVATAMMLETECPLPYPLFLVNHGVVFTN